MDADTTEFSSGTQTERAFDVFVDKTTEIFLVVVNPAVGASINTRKYGYFIMRLVLIETTQFKR